MDSHSIKVIEGALLPCSDFGTCLRIPVVEFVGVFATENAEIVNVRIVIRCLIFMVK